MLWTVQNVFTVNNRDARTTSTVIVNFGNCQRSICHVNVFLLFVTLNGGLPATTVFSFITQLAKIGCLNL